MLLLAGFPWLSNRRTLGYFVLRFKAADVLPGDMTLDHLLDTVELFDLIGAHQ